MTTRPPGRPPGRPADEPHGQPPEDDDPPCSEVVELLTDYLDEALPPADRARLDLHLADCDGCSTVLDQFRTTIAATGGLGADDVDRLDDDARTALLDVFRRWTTDRPG